jgi:biopolymer transport protein ExbB/TolQ
VILALCAIYAVALLFEKIYVMRKASKQTKDFLTAFRKANSVEEAEAIVRKLPSSGIKSMFDAGMAEVRRTQDLGLYTMRDARDHTMQRVSSAMQTRQNDHLEDLGSSMTFLASIGANAPFIGLFGTVWGIMVAFVGIAKTQTTSLAVVAPGIAGALLATAGGADLQLRRQANLQARPEARRLRRRVHRPRFPRHGPSRGLRIGLALEVSPHGG